MQHVPAAGEQRLVGSGCRARVVGVELRPPERADVRLVPDDDVVDRREADNGVLGIAAKLGARGVVLRRARRVAVDGQHETQATRGRDGVGDIGDVLGRQVALAGRPLQRDPERARADSPARFDRAGAAPLRAVVAEAEEEV
jgi:hypothetical protein